MRPRLTSFPTSLSRRSLLKATGAGIAGSACIGAALSTGFQPAALSQIEATPPEVPSGGRAGPPPESVADVAARLGYDQDAIFGFVRDEIHFESYAGILRGAKGALWARSGNAADQAILLGELLAASGLPYRFATAALDGESEGALVSLLSPTSEQARSHYAAAVTAMLVALSGEERLPDVATPATTGDQAVLDEFEAMANGAIALGASTTGTVHGMLQDALADASVSLAPLEPPALTDRERLHHAWVQVPDGPAWIDLDPSLGEAGADLPSPVPEDTFEAFPDDWMHTLMVRIVAEELSGGTLARRDAVSLGVAAHLVLDVPIALSIASTDELADLGLTINELFTGQKTLFPTIYVDGQLLEASRPMVFATEGSSVLDLFGEATPIVGAADGETVGVWLAVDIASPDAAPVTIERALLDRIPPEDRSSGVLTPANIAPIETVPSEVVDDPISQFNALTILHVDVARIPGMYALRRALDDEVFGELGVLGSSLASLRDSLGLQEESAAGYWSYPSAPNVTAFTVTPPDAGGGLAGVSADLVYRQRASCPLSGLPPAAGVHPLVLSGVLDTVAERVLLAPETRGQLADAAPISEEPSIGALFEAVQEENVEVRVIRTPADLATVEADPAAGLLIARALDAGAVVVAPAQPVAVGGEPLFGWWIVDPATGRTIDQFSNGRSAVTTSIPAQFAARFAEGFEYTMLGRALAWLTTNAKMVSCIGNAVGFVAGIATMLLAGYVGSEVGGGIATLATFGQMLRMWGACLPIV